MSTETRPICQYAMATLKKNSTRLLITMCIGLALAMYGIYVTNRGHSNPHYMPTISVAGHWLYNMFGQKILYPSNILKPCTKNTFTQTVPHFLMRALIKPIVHYSGLVNGLINIVQIVLLKVYCSNMMATNAIIALSATGWLISMVCLFGAFATCKLMCISCLGIQHKVIIYLAWRRRAIIQNMFCPPLKSGSTNNTGAGVAGSNSIRTRRANGACS